MDRLVKASINTWNGLMAAARSEAAFRQELAVFVLSVPFAFLLTGDNWKRLALIGVVLLVMIVELLNTAIEKLADHVTPTHHVEIGRVKDIGSAAVGLSLLVAGLTWLLAIGERLAGG